jgi:hypothetical protein
MDGLAVRERPETPRMEMKMRYDPQELFRSAASLAALGMKVVKLYGIRDNGSCTCSKGHDCPSKGKHPAGDAGWQHRATDDEEEIASWFEGCNDNVRWNIGVRLGRVSGIIDIEADDEQAMEVIRRYGLDQIDTTAFRGSRGPHYLFQYDPELPDVGVTKVDGLECRLGGGETASQSVFPKSWHKTKVQYGWLPGRSPDEVRPAPLPEAFKQAILANSRGKGTGTIAKAKDAILSDHKVGEGGRHAFLLGIASWLSQQCRDYSDVDRMRVVTLMLAANGCHCDPPKTEDEVCKVANDQFAYYQNRHLARRNQRPFERYGLQWNLLDREWEPGAWQVTVVHSDPREIRLLIPSLETGQKPYRVSLDSKQWVTARDVAVAVFEATGRIDLLDPNPARWTAIWNGENVEDERGERRQVRGLRAKLMEQAVEEFPPPENNRYAALASALLAFLHRYEPANTATEDEVLPNHSGLPVWIRSKKGRDELWLKWHETINKVFAVGSSSPPSGKEINNLRARLLEAAGKARFEARKKQIAGVNGRWLIWTQVEIAALEKLAYG